jgi:hypothetical protein
VSAAYVLVADVPLSPGDAELMVLTGFATTATDGVLTLTDKGGKWVREWCQSKIAEVKP